MVISGPTIFHKRSFDDFDTKQLFYFIFLNYFVFHMLYYHTCTPPQDIYDEMVQHFYGLARSVGYVEIEKNIKKPPTEVGGWKNIILL